MKLTTLEQEILLLTTQLKGLIDAIVGQRKIAFILGNSNRNYLHIYKDFPLYYWDEHLCFTTPSELKNWIEKHQKELGFTLEERKRRSRHMKQIRQAGPGRGHKKCK